MLIFNICISRIVSIFFSVTNCDHKLSIYPCTLGLFENNFVVPDNLSFNTAKIFPCWEFCRTLPKIN
jgi:hypothetical protein